MSTKIWLIGGALAATAVALVVVVVSGLRGDPEIVDRTPVPAPTVAEPAASETPTLTETPPDQAAAALRPAAELGPEGLRYADRVLGDPDAPVEIIEYSSLTCPHCASFHADTLPEFKREFIDTGRVRIVYRDFPFDRAALGAAMTARCLPPDRYFGFLDGLFRAQAQWSRAQDPAAELQRLARVAGLSPTAFEACLADQRLADTILERRLDAEQRFGVRSTPSFVIQGGQELLVGNQPIERFREVIDRLAPPRG